MAILTLIFEYYYELYKKREREIRWAKEKAR